MVKLELHRLARRGDVVSLRELLSRHPDHPQINDYDPTGRTPLMVAASQPAAPVEIVNLLLKNGSDISLASRERSGPSATVMNLALGAGNPEVIRLLLRAGAPLDMPRENGYTALIHAVHSRDVFRDARLIELLQLLIEQGAELNAISSYGESGLRVLSRLGRFDAVKVLLDAADPSQLEWTSLHRAVALGSLEEVLFQVEAGASLDELDRWQRTPWLLALQTGEVPKAQFLLERGANSTARGRCGKPPLLYAIETHCLSMLKWLIEIGAGVNDVDDHGGTPLAAAVEADDLEAVDGLLAAGANVAHEQHDETSLSLIRSPEVGKRLLAAGADPRFLKYQSQRILLGYSIDTEGESLNVSPEDFDRARTRRFGTANPERMQERFWEEMIRTGLDAFQACGQFEANRDFNRAPIWCAQRFGQSMTFLADGRIIQIAGEHEDHYDPDFCIYNDVFVHLPDGSVKIYGYPESVFLPTDFHTATLVEDGSIWIIGSLGYPPTRRVGQTPAYRFDPGSMKIETIETTGENPGWISSHRARLTSATKVEISGGWVAVMVDAKQELIPSDRIFVLDTKNRHWLRV